MRIALAALLFAGIIHPAFAQATATPAATPFDEAAWSAEFDTADTNRDGKLSKSEAQAANPNLGDHFDVIDANKDGFVTPDEDRAMLARGEKAATPNG